MNDIRNLILETIFNQSLKLLRPGSTDFDIHTPEPDDHEESMLTRFPPLLEYVQMGGVEIRDETPERVTRHPALYIANGTESLEIQAGSGLGNLLGIEMPYVGESYPVVLRLVVNQGIAPAYDKSNPVIIARIREQLDYFLDATYFRGLRADRIGYQFPSVVITAGITASYNLEAIATPWEVYDFRLEVIFKRQKEMSD